MRRVLMLNYEFPPLGGGAANATFFLLKEFSKIPDIKIDLVTSSVDGFKREIFSPNITIHYLDIGKKGNLHYQSMMDLLRYSAAAFSYAKRLMREQKYDLCHAFFGIPCGFVAMKLGLPYIVSLRGSDVPFHNKKFRWLDRLFFRRLSRRIWARATSVVANSEGLRKTALMSSPSQKISIIMNGVDTDLFHHSSEPSFPRRRESSDSNNTLKLVSVGRLTAIKGYDYLIKALTGMADVELTLVGDGPQIEELQALAKACSVKVNFLGKLPREEIAVLLRAMDVYVSSSINEGMSNSVMEAMASGLPLVATRTGGTDELLDDGVSGYIVERGSEADLRQAIEKIIAAPEQRHEMGARARAKAESMSWRSAADGYVNLYRLESTLL